MAPDGNGRVVGPPAFVVMRHLAVALLALSLTGCGSIVPTLPATPSTPPPVEPSSSPTAPPSSPTPSIPLPAGTVPPGSTSRWVSLDVEPLPLAPAGLGWLIPWAGGYLAFSQPDGSVPPTAWLSRDGRSWTALPPDVFGLEGWTVQEPIMIWAGSACATGLAVVTQDFVGTNLIWTSLDGRSWLPRAWAGTDAPRTMATNGRTDVLVTDDGRLYTSRDCGTWTPAVLPAPANGVSAEALAAFAGGYVAGGFLSTGTGSDGAPIGRPLAWWSPDGLAWHAASVSPRPGDGFIDMEAGAHGVVGTTNTVGYIPGSRTLWASPDGRQWATGARSPLGLQPSGEGVGDPNGEFTGDGSRLIVFGSTDPTNPAVANQLWTSSDGVIWSRVAVTGGAARRVMAFNGPTPYLVRDGLLFSGPSGTWFGAAK